MKPDPDADDEQLALELGPAAISCAAKDLQLTPGRAKDTSGRLAGVRDLEQLEAALRFAPGLNGEDRRRLFEAVATDRTMALLVKLITDAEQVGAAPAGMNTAMTLRAVLRVLGAARRPPWTS